MTFSLLRRNAAALAIAIAAGAPLAAQPTTPHPTVFGPAAATRSIVPASISGPRGNRSSTSTPQAPPPAHPRNNIPL